MPWRNILCLIVLSKSLIKNTQVVINCCDVTILLSKNVFLDDQCLFEVFFCIFVLSKSLINTTQVIISFCDSTMLPRKSIPLWSVPFCGIILLYCTIHELDKQFPSGYNLLLHRHSPHRISFISWSVPLCCILLFHCTVQDLDKHFPTCHNFLQHHDAPLQNNFPSWSVPSRDILLLHCTVQKLDKQFKQLDVTSPGSSRNIFFLMISALT